MRSTSAKPCCPSPNASVMHPQHRACGGCATEARLFSRWPRTVVCPPLPVYEPHKTHQLALGAARPPPQKRGKPSTSSTPRGLQDDFGHCRRCRHHLHTPSLQKGRPHAAYVRELRVYEQQRFSAGAKPPRWRQQWRIFRWQLRRPQTTWRRPRIDRRQCLLLKAALSVAAPLSKKMLCCDSLRCLPECSDAGANV